MPLGPGTRLGPYEIVSALGAGGMGEVYRARDTRLGRDVALKILPGSFAADPQRLARFEQEARAAAALNHPSLLAVYDIGSHDNSPYIVSELLEGSTLRDRITGPLPIRKVLDYAVQLAHGLAAAHERTIVHRDLKPENIFITSDGRVKILDFGLAKLIQPDVVAAGISIMPTGFEAARVSPDTLPGVVLGTVGYMAPEQVRGQAADHRADIFAFGAILYEMVTGLRAFRGDTTADAMSAILAKDPPDITSSDGRVPPGLARIVDRCLEKSATARFQSTRDLAFALEALTSLSELRAAQAVQADTGPGTSEQRWVWAAWSVAALAVVAAAVFAGLWMRAGTPVSERSLRFQIPPPGPATAELFTLSPDGRAIAFVTSKGGPDQIWVRSLEALEARPLPGTDGASYPFWSPDGMYLGFFAQGKLKKIAAGGGPPQTLCDSPSGRGGTWNRNGIILFSAGPTSAILRVSDAGGMPTPVTQLTPGELDGHRFPRFLPDGVHFLYNAGSNKAESAGVYVGALDGSGSARLLPDQTNAAYTIGDDGLGYVLFRRDETLMAQRFEIGTRSFAGDIFPVAEHVPFTVNTGNAAFSVSDRGVLAYRTGDITTNRELVWVDRSGKRLGTATKPGSYDGVGPALSPDGRTIAFGVRGGSTSDIWLQDVNRDVMTRFTFRPGANRNPVWSPDGTRLLFAIQPVSAYSAGLYVKPASGGGTEQLLLQGGVNAFSLDWSNDGRWIVYQQQGQTTGLDLWLLPLEGERKPASYLQTPFEESDARFAPSPGPPRWMAYQSNESGQTQVYVQSIPATGAKYQLSTTGGEQPTWRSDGKELFYITPDRKLMAVSIALDQSAEVSTPRELFANAGMSTYAVARDGQRFLVNVPVGGDNAVVPPITMVVNWISALKLRASR